MHAHVYVYAHASRACLRARVSACVCVDAGVGVGVGNTFSHMPTCVRICWHVHVHMAQSSGCDPPGRGDVNADVGRKGEVACAQVEQVVDVLDNYCVVVEEEHTAVLYQLEHLHLGKRTNAVPLKRLDLALLDSFRHEPLLNAVTHADTEAQQWVRCLDTHQ